MQLRSRDKPFARADVIARVLDVDADRVPLAILRSIRRVSQVVLAAELVGNAGRRGIQIACTADDLGPPAAVVGDLAQRERVHAIVHAPSASRIRRGVRWRRRWWW